MCLQDSSGGKTGSTKSGGGILDFFGGSSSQPTDSLQKPVSWSMDNYGNVIATTGAPPPPSPCLKTEEVQLTAFYKHYRMLQGRVDQPPVLRWSCER